jgi:hypothetical protein
MSLVANNYGKHVHELTFASRSAIRYLGPSFSSSAMTQSVMHGVAFASRQSIMALIISSLFCKQPREAHAACGYQQNSN